MNRIAIFIFAALSMASCSSWQKIGKLTTASTRMESDTLAYILIDRNVEGIAPMIDSDALEQAMNVAVRKYPNGEYMKNVEIWVMDNGEFVKVLGEVWGTGYVRHLEAERPHTYTFNLGDQVMFRNSFGKKLKGKVTAINSKTAVVQVTKESGELSEYTLKFEQISRTE